MAGLGNITRRIEDAPSSIIFQFVSTFGSGVVSERLGMSPILSVVAYGMTLARLPGAYQSASLRIPSFAVWDTAVVVLNIVAFLVIGLELGAVITAAPEGELGRWATVGTAVLLTVIAVRSRLDARGRPLEPSQIDRHEGWDVDGVPRTGAPASSSAGRARGASSPLRRRWPCLATSLSATCSVLRLRRHARPPRDPRADRCAPLVKALRLADDGPVAREVRTARVALAEAGLSATRDGRRGRRDPAGGTGVRTRVAQEATEGEAGRHRPEKALRARVLAVRRQRLLALRRDGMIGDDAFHIIEEELDLADLATATRT